MKTSAFLTLLQDWLKCESCVDKSGYISPSITAIHSTHYYFIKTGTEKRRVETVKEDTQGGIIITYIEDNNVNKYMIHVMLDGTFDIYTTNPARETYKERYILDNNKKGFGTASYKMSDEE